MKDAKTIKSVTIEIIKQSNPIRPEPTLNFSFFDCPNCKSALAYSIKIKSLYCKKCDFKYMALSPEPDVIPAGYESVLGRAGGVK